MGADLILSETHAPSFFLSDPFFLLKPLPPTSLWYVKRFFGLYLHVYIYLQLKQFIGFPCVTEILTRLWSVPSFGKQTWLCCLSGKLLLRGNCTRKRVLQKVQRVCGVELTCIKKVFLHLKYPAGRQPDCTELHTLSSGWNKDPRVLGR